MRIGVIPAPGSGLASMAATGQLERLYAHLGYYATIGEVSYVTWGDDYPEEARLWQPFAQRTGARLIPAGRWQNFIDRCDVFRCMNLRATWPVLWWPFVVSYGADYLALARIHRRPAWKVRLLRAFTMRRAAHVLVPNRALATDLMLRYPGRPIAYHPNWVDCERFRPSPIARGRRPKIVLFVGRMVLEKGLERLARVVASIHEVRLRCIGEGPLRSALTQLGAECLGARAWTELPGWYHDADVFALPSLSEGGPKALQEAMACGLPCLVSSAVTEGGDAVLRTDDLAAGLRVLLEEPAGQALGQAARAYAGRYYNVTDLMPKELTWLQQAARSA